MIKKSLSLVAVLLLSALFLTGCGETEPVAINVGDSIETEAIDFTVESIACSQDIGYKSVVVKDAEANSQGYLVAICKIYDKTGADIPADAFSFQFLIDGKEYIPTAILYNISIKENSSSYYSETHISKGDNNIMFVVLELDRAMEEIGPVEFKMGFNDVFSSVSGKKLASLDNVYTMNEESPYKQKEIKKGDKVTKEGQYEFTVQGEKEGDCVQDEWSSVAFSEYGVYIPLKFKYLGKTGTATDIIPSERCMLKCGEYMYEGNTWEPQSIVPMGTGVVYIYFEVPKEMVDSSEMKIINFRVGDDDYSYTFK